MDNGIALGDIFKEIKKTADIKLIKECSQVVDNPVQVCVKQDFL